MITLITSMAVTGSASGTGLANDAAPANHQPSVTVTDMGISTGFQDTQFGHLERGRALIAADFNLDGRNDFFVGNPGEESYILLNTKGPRGTPLFVMGPVLLTGTLAGSAVAADYDNDGDPDLFVGVGGLEGIGYNLLFRNMFEESGRTDLWFEDVSKTAGIEGPTPPGYSKPMPVATYGIAAGDYDRDGWIDFFVSVVINDWTPVPWKGRNILWHNNHDGTFTDVTDDVGLGVTREDTRHSTWIDIDNDGDLDLYENDMLGPSHLWRNELVETGRPTFEDVTKEFSPPGEKLACPWQSFDSVAADFNNDGWQDLMVFMRWEGAEPPGCPYPPGNAIFMNMAGHGFRNIGPSTGMRPFIWDKGVMGCQVGDVNGDGSPDVYIGNGAPMDNGNPDGGQVDQLFVSNQSVGGLPKFVDWTPSIDFAAPEQPGITYPQYPYRTHGTDFVDVDGDGRPEIAVAEGGPAASPDYVREPDRLFKLGLDPEPNWLLVHPVGDGEHVSTDAINTRFALTVTDGSRTWTVHQTLLAASCFSAQNGFDVYFGLSGATSIVSLEVDWPDGAVETITDGLHVNERIEVSREDMRGVIGTRMGHVSDDVVREVAALPPVAPDATAVKLASYPKGAALAFRCG